MIWTLFTCNTILHTDRGPGGSMS